MKTIWKYSLDVTDVQTIEMPDGATPLCVQVQDGMPCLWAVVDSSFRRKDRRFYTCGTGHIVPDDVVAYIGTYQLDDGALVFHVFEAP